jgi:hypothetical protein
MQSTQLQSHIDELFKKLNIFDYHNFSIMLNDLDHRDFKVAHYIDKLQLQSEDGAFDIAQVQNAMVMFNKILQETCEQIADNVDKNLFSYVEISHALEALKTKSQNQITAQK